MIWSADWQSEFRAYVPDLAQQSHCGIDVLQEVFFNFSVFGHGIAEHFYEKHAKCILNFFFYDINRTLS